MARPVRAAKTEGSIADSMPVDFFSKPISEIEEIGRMPVGVYVFEVLDWSYVRSREKKTPGVQFTFKYLECLSDPLPEGLPEDITKRKAKDTFWVTEDSLHILAQWLKEVIKVDPTLSGEDSLNAAKGATLLATVKHEPFQDDPGKFRTVLTDYQPDEDEE